MYYQVLAPPDPPEGVIHVEGQGCEPQRRGDVGKLQGEREGLAERRLGGEEAAVGKLQVISKVKLVKRKENCVPFAKEV